MTLYRAQLLDTPDDPFLGGTLRSEADGGLLVRDGLICERAPFELLRSSYPDEPLVHLETGLLLPGLVDTHVHFPQLRAIGALGMPLLEWLERNALPEEARFADSAYAAGVAGEFVAALLAAGTTTALAFGAHFAPAVDLLFQAAESAGLRLTAGLVVSDRALRPELHTTAQRAYDEGLALAGRWHGTGRLRYAVTPRFALSCTDELLASCGALLRDVPGSRVTSHLNESPAEIAAVRELFGGSYSESYHTHGLVNDRSVFAHNVHPADAELELLAVRGAGVSHCPTSNAALGSGLFPLERHLAFGVGVSLGCDVGAGSGFSMFKEALQAYFMQRLRGADGVPLSAAHLLHLVTSAGADALGLRSEIGDLSAGKRFDALWLNPDAGTPLRIGLNYADGPEDALARAFTLATTADVAAVWIDGTQVAGHSVVVVAEDEES